MLDFIRGAAAGFAVVIAVVGLFFVVGLSLHTSFHSPSSPVVLVP